MSPEMFGSRLGVFLLSACAALILLAPALAPADPPDAPSLLGFSAASAATELALEKRFQAIPDPARMRANMQCGLAV